MEIGNRIIMEQKKKTAITKEKILRAAELEFSELGLAASRVDSIASKAGVNKQMIYAHYGSKEGLYTAVLQEVYSRISKNEAIASKEPFCGIESIRKLIRSYFEFLYNNTSFVRLMQWENLNNARYVENIKTALFSGAKALLNKGIESGALRSDLDVDQTVISLNMFCFSAFSNIHTISKLLNVDLSTKAEYEKRASHIEDILINYICK